MRYLLLTFIISFFSFVLPSYAQDSSLWVPRTPEKKEYSPTKLFEQLPPEIQEEILEETEQVFQKCQEISGPSEQIIDCRCLSLKFLDKRVLDGPAVSKEHLVQSLDTKECKSLENMAGRLYNFCATNYYFMSGYEEMCRCAANKGSKNLMKYDIATTKAFAYQLAQGLKDCDPNWLVNNLLGKGGNKNNQISPPQAP